MANNGGWIILAVAVGGALGAVLRYCALLAGRRMSKQFPWATFTINVIGSFALGVLAGGADVWGLHPLPVAALGAGMLGGFTTFSTFAVESVRVWRGNDGKARGAAYIVLTLLSSIAAAAMGLTLL